MRPVSAGAENVKKILLELVRGSGHEIVVVNLFSRPKGRTLQIMIEKLDEAPVSIDDCEKVSRIVSASLLTHDPIKGEYDLEISSTGINRPLVSPGDFIRFLGSPVVVNTYVSQTDRKTFKGNLELANECGIRIALDLPLSSGERVAELTYEEICSAHIDGFKK
jgi:ribosome maturation factor RimP